MVQLSPLRRDGDEQKIVDCKTFISAIIRVKDMIKIMLEDQNRTSCTIMMLQMLAKVKMKSSSFWKESLSLSSSLVIVFVFVLLRAKVKEKPSPPLGKWML